ncbi:MAG: hypothetical protein Q8L72_08435 [Moraxellaceae bacterium]|nr:hypothetical protein [Moraxellaceae bacterium]
MLPNWVQASAVQMHAVPAAAVSALRSALPTLQTVDSGAELQLIWQAQHYQQLSAKLSTPAIVLLAYPGQANVRPQDMALYWSPTLAQQLQLAQELNPGLKRVGVVLSPATKALFEAFKQAVQAQSIVVESLVIDGDINTRQLAAFMQSVDVLLAAPDEQLFSPINAKLLLLPSYRLQRPWVGPNAAFVQAGAVATQQVSRATLINAISSAISHWQQHKNLPASRVLSADEVVVNAPVLRSLGLRQPRARP